ncbi:MULTISPECIES: phytochelatin synthase family protein [Alphaproteobacteria]|uniref:glutathione gamma-glutamylcysteinyltransferase n=2 Tax=Alphaproteobacteria TaxID=28211 RepID=A0A512HI44_9HYPH|nr:MULTISPECIES: phytochelatin synthase family protein [Alphaproteobacteria]GEO85121.1 hypothetical protein RNA01_20530 [Ciceribacter naphthalenivorans]
MILKALFTSLSLSLLAGVAAAEDVAKPKLGPEAIPITTDHAYLSTAAAPDYWAISPYYIHQQTSSACSLASITIAVNTMRGLPALSENTLVTQNNLLEATKDKRWAEQAAEEGDGVTFADLVADTAQSLKAFDIKAEVTAAQPTKDKAATLEAFRAMLVENETSAKDMVLIYFNQGVVTGDWDGPHVSPIGAYDAATDRVLIMDVDREWYVPYWTKTETLFKAFQRPAPADQGVLAGETGGWVRITKS